MNSNRDESIYSDDRRSGPPGFDRAYDLDPSKEPESLNRPRFWVYGAIGVVGLAAVFWAFSSFNPFVTKESRDTVPGSLTQVDSSQPATLRPSLQLGRVKWSGGKSLLIIKVKADRGTEVRIASAADPRTILATTVVLDSGKSRLAISGLDQAPCKVIAMADDEPSFEKAVAQAPHNCK